MIKDKKRVWLSIKGVSQDNADEPSLTKIETVGDLYNEAGASCLTYEETEMSGMEGTTTTVKVSDGKVSVIRLGNVNSLMEFEEGQRQMTMYNTPYGDMSMGIFTKGINVAYDDDQTPVKVSVAYDIDISGIGYSTHSLDIDINEYKA